MSFADFQRNGDRTCQNHDPAFKARVALVALNGERRVSKLSCAYGVLPAMIHQWTNALLEREADIFVRSSKRSAPEFDEAKVK